LADYHDREWGTPVHAEADLFKALVLTYFENGLSWAVVFNKREALNRAFTDFDPAAVATMTHRDVDRLMRDHTIIRNRAKIEATVHNARLLTSLSLNDIAWRYRPPLQRTGIENDHFDGCFRAPAPDRGRRRMANLSARSRSGNANGHLAVGGALRSKCS
jgi:DNA-3-methyladenine glycosylase I